MTMGRSQIRSVSREIGPHRLEQELHNFSLTLRAQPTLTPAPTEPFSKTVCQYTDTLCATEANKSHKFPATGHYSI